MEEQRNMDGQGPSIFVSYRNDDIAILEPIFKALSEKYYIWYDADTENGNSVLGILSGAFSGCTNLKTVTIQRPESSVQFYDEMPYFYNLNREQYLEQLSAASDAFPPEAEIQYISSPSDDFVSIIFDGPA